MAKSKKNINTEIEIKSIDEIPFLQKEYNCQQKVIFICEKCKNITKVSLRQMQKRLKIGLFCRNCCSDISKKEKYGENFKKILGKRHSEKLKSRTKEQIDLTTKKYKSTCLKKYGVDNPNKNKNIIEKTQKTNLDRYGTTCTLFIEKAIKNKKQILKENAVEIAEKKHKTWKNRTVEQKAASKEKARQTSLERYGTEWVSQSNESKAKAAETREFFTDEQKAEIQKKRKATCLEKYGTEIASQNEDIKKKTLKHTKKSILEKYGVEYYQQTLESHHKRKSHFEYNGLNFDSAPELAFYIYNKDFGYNIKVHSTKIKYEFEGKDHFYIPDFEVDGQFFEIKGNHLVKDGKWINPFDPTKNALCEVKQQIALQNNVVILYSEDYEKYLQYIEETYGKNYLLKFKRIH